MESGSPTQEHFCVHCTLSPVPRRVGVTFFMIIMIMHMNTILPCTWVPLLLFLGHISKIPVTVSLLHAHFNYQTQYFLCCRICWWNWNTSIMCIQLRNPTLQLSIQCPPKCTPKRPSSEPHGAARQQATAKTSAKWSAYQILSVFVVFVVLVFKL
jgi:hypothetical protein